MDMASSNEHVIVRGDAMMPLEYFDFEFSEPTMRHWLEARDRCPNLLIQCTPGSEDRVTAKVRQWCGNTPHVCNMPGPLRLPVDPMGTLVLNDAADMNLGQQLVLHDWMTEARGARVISVTSAHLPTLVAEGRFLEALFYRLNIVWVDAREKRRAPKWMPRLVLQ